MCFHTSSFIFDRIIIKVAGNQDRHKMSDLYVHLYVFWNEIWLWFIGLSWAIVALWATCSLKIYIDFTAKYKLRFLLQDYLFKFTGRSRSILWGKSDPWKQRYFLLKRVGNRPILEYFNKKPKSKNATPRGIKWLETLEQEQDKTKKVAFAPSKDSDLPAHPPSLIRSKVFAVHNT